jgi:hypothetical protein
MLQGTSTVKESRRFGNFWLQHMLKAHLGQAQYLHGRNKTKSSPVSWVESSSLSHTTQVLCVILQEVAIDKQDQG